jgi:hypothetical protein
MFICVSFLSAGIIPPSGMNNNNPGSNPGQSNLGLHTNPMYGVELFHPVSERCNNITIKQCSKFSSGFSSDSLIF